MTAMMDEGLAMIEAARRAHEQRQREGLVVVTAVDQMADMLIKTGNRRMAKGMGHAKYARMLYANYIMKRAAMWVIEQLIDSIAKSHIKSSQRAVRQYREEVKYWDVDMSKLPSGTEASIDHMTSWAWDDKLKNLIDHHHYAYSMLLSKRQHDIDLNSADLVAWILTLRDMADSCIAHDKLMLPEMNKYLCGVLPEYRAELKDVAYVIRRFTSSLLGDIFGKTVYPTSPDVETGRKTLLNYLRTFDAVSYIVQHLAQVTLAEDGYTCPADRCRDCQWAPCDTIKAAKRYILDETNY